MCGDVGERWGEMGRWGRCAEMCGDVGRDGEVEEVQGRVPVDAPPLRRARAARPQLVRCTLQLQTVHLILQ